MPSAIPVRRSECRAVMSAVGVSMDQKLLLYIDVPPGGEGKCDFALQHFRG